MRIPTLGFFLLCSLAFGQSENSIHVKDFPGTTLDEKLSAAAKSCNQGLPCVLIVDASLAALPSGAIHASCDRCVVEDFRSAPPGSMTGIQVPPGNGTISAALKANPNGNSEFKLGCGTYADNITINMSFVWIHGGGVGCTMFIPSDTTKPAITVTQSGTAGTYYAHISDMQLSAYGLRSTSDGIQLNTSTSAPNTDYTTLENLRIDTFQNGLSILGGILWLRTENLHIYSNTQNGLNIVPSSPGTEPVNFLEFDGFVSSFNGKYGVYANTGNAVSWNFHHIDIEQNGTSIVSGAGCAGMYFDSSRSLVLNVNIDGQSYFEANCLNSAQSDAAQIRITGTHAIYGFNIKDNFFSGAASNGCGVFSDVTAGAGVIENNYGGMQASACGAIYRIMNSDVGQGEVRRGISIWTVGPNIYFNQGQLEYKFSGTGAMRYIGVAAGGITNFASGISSGGMLPVYRCTAAGRLPVGAITTTSTDCGASAETGLSVK
jgi:hypothetical protein